MEIALFFGLMAAYVILSQAKFSQQRDPAYRERVRRRQDIRDRHARWRRQRAEKENSAGTQGCAASSCCA